MLDLMQLIKETYFCLNSCISENGQVILKKSLFACIEQLFQRNLRLLRVGQQKGLSQFIFGLLALLFESKRMFDLGNARLTYVRGQTVAQNWLSWEKLINRIYRAWDWRLPFWNLLISTGPDLNRCRISSKNPKSLSLLDMFCIFYRRQL